MDIQSFIFDKKTWNPKSAETWLRSKGWHTILDEKENFLRYRQKEPSAFQQDSFRTHHVPDEEGIQVVIGKILPPKR